MSYECKLIISFLFKQTIRKDIDNITKQQEEENVRLGQSIHKMQDRLDETFLRASDTKQIGREIIKNTEDLLREANKVRQTFDNCSIVITTSHAQFVFSLSASIMFTRFFN